LSYVVQNISEQRFRNWRTKVPSIWAAQHRPEDTCGCFNVPCTKSCPNNSLIHSPASDENVCRSSNTGQNRTKPLIAQGEQSTSASGEGIIGTETTTIEISTIWGNSPPPLVRRECEEQSRCIGSRNGIKTPERQSAIILVYWGRWDGSKAGLETGKRGIHS